MKLGPLVYRTQAQKQFMNLAHLDMYFLYTVTSIMKVKKPSSRALIHMSKLIHREAYQCVEYKI